MYLTHISLSNFRVFRRLDIDVPRRILLLVGDNAQGKTTILEAVYYLSTFSSFFAQTDGQLINYSLDNEPVVVGRIIADFQRGEKAHRIEVRIIHEVNGRGAGATRKEILLDGVRRTAQKAIGTFNAVIFLPQMMRIIEGGPEERRRYLNLAISQADNEYASDLVAYQKILTRRNALLKQLSERGGDPDQLYFWDEKLVEKGSNIILARIRAITELERHAARVHDELTRSMERLRLIYLPAFDPARNPTGQYTLPLDRNAERINIDIETIRSNFQKRLLEVRKEDIYRGLTTIGPHRDDMRVLANKTDLGDFGSRGQARTALLAMKMAEVYWLRKETGHWPVMLLDEILVELDTKRREDLLVALQNFEQVLMTTTDLNLFERDFVNSSVIWTVENGFISNS